MSYIMNGILSDQSTQDEFRFSVSCAECGREWECRRIRFSKAGVAPETEHKRVIYKTLYERERKLLLTRRWLRRRNSSASAPFATALCATAAS